MSTIPARKIQEDEGFACETTGKPILVYDSEVSDPFEGFFPPTSQDFVDSLIEMYDKDKERIENVAQYMGSEDAEKALKHFTDGNLWDERHGLPRKLDQLFSLEGAVANLNASYWSRALSYTDVYDYMPQARRDEWSEQIRHPLGRRETAGSKEILPLPDFQPDSVRATLQGLLNSRAQFFSERIDGIFRGLSRDHVTNRPEGFSRRMIINRAISDVGTVDFSTAGLVNDLRCVIAKFVGRDEPNWGATSKVFEVVRQQNGVWHSIDGGVLQMRIYNGVGTVHLEVHPMMAYRLNAVLASLYPKAIPEKYRKKPKATRKTKDFNLFDKPLPFAVLDCLAGLKQGFEMVKENFKTHRRLIPNSLGAIPAYSTDKALRAQAEGVLRAIGGVFDGRFWLFDYEPTGVVNEIICTGSIPEQKSYQFYPTPDDLAQEVVSIASVGAEAGMSWLEPSAGVGSIAQYVPNDAYLVCNEISELHCKILKTRWAGSKECSSRAFVNEDFLVFARNHAGEGFDRIVMNPPFSEGRWEAHLEAAAGLLASGGRLVAILPSSAKGKELVSGFKHEYGEVLDNKFAGASISVVLLTLT